jgi:hypothetical protein
MKNNIVLKYACLDRLDDVIKKCQDDTTKNLILDLRDLIIYQMKEIENQRRQIVAKTHKEAWKRYDQPE